jgi:RHS repeat-associated protein
VDLSPLASVSGGCTVAGINVGADGTTLNGAWNIYFNEIVIVSAHGTVRPIYAKGKTVGVGGWNTSSGMTGVGEIIEHWTGAGPWPHDSTTYYHSDHLGTSRILTSYWGWPVWQGTFAPYGQEVSAQMTTNNYKFTGDEHDTESNTEHTQFRQLATTQGRWLSPDPWLGSIDLTNPQSFNRYAYVSNNPLNDFDPWGLTGGMGCLSANGSMGGCDMPGVAGGGTGISIDGGSQAFQGTTGSIFEIFQIPVATTTSYRGPQLIGSAPVVSNDAGYSTGVKIFAPASYFYDQTNIGTLGDLLVFRFPPPAPPTESSWWETYGKSFVTNFSLNDANGKDLCIATFLSATGAALAPTGPSPTDALEEVCC